jgi:hypothetical protein
LTIEVPSPNPDEIRETQHFHALNVCPRDFAQINRRAPRAGKLEKVKVKIPAVEM